MITAALVLMAAGQQLPENPSFDYSGMPHLSAPARVVTHSVTIELADKIANVTSTTVFRSDADVATPVQVVVPRLRLGDAQSGNPNFAISASWDRAPLPLTAASIKGMSAGVGGKTVQYRSDLVGKATLKPQGTHALRISYSVPFGKAGYDQKQKIAGYLFDTSPTIGQMNIAYRYGGKTVFRLPEANPTDWPWQIGTKGVFIREENFTPAQQLSYITFYPGGFEKIGGGR